MVTIRNVSKSRIWTKTPTPRFYRESMIEASVAHGMHSSIEEASIDITPEKRREAEERAETFRKRKNRRKSWIIAPLPKSK